MKRLLLTAFLATGAFPVAAYAVDGLAICVRCPSTTMVSISGQDTADAKALSKVSKADYDDCAAANGQACAADYFKVDQRITASADCRAGNITDDDGKTFTLVGRWSYNEPGSGLNDGMLKFRGPDGELEPGSNASSGQALAANYQMLCPMTFVRAAARDSDGGSFEVGRQSTAERVSVASLDGMPYDHNGSIVIVDPAKGLIVYETPKASIRGTVKPGTVLFRGRPWDPQSENVVITGRSRVFKKGCNPAEYDVRGMYSMHGGMQAFELEGASPVRSKTSCKITGHTINSPNATLGFVAAWD